METDAAVPWEGMCDAEHGGRSGTGRAPGEEVVVAGVGLGTVRAWAPRSAPRRGVLMDRGPTISKRLLVTAEGQILRAVAGSSQLDPTHQPTPCLLAAAGFRCRVDSLRLGPGRELGLCVGVCPVVLPGR